MQAVHLLGLKRSAAAMAPARRHFHTLFSLRPRLLPAATTRYHTMPVRPFSSNAGSHYLSSDEETEERADTGVAEKLQAAYRLIKEVQRGEVTYICDGAVPLDV